MLASAAAAGRGLLDEKRLGVRRPRLYSFH